MVVVRLIVGGGEGLCIGGDGGNSQIVRDWQTRRKKRKRV